MDLLRLGDAAHAANWYHWAIEKFQIHRMSTIRFILVVAIVVFAGAILGLVFSRRKRNPESSTGPVTE